jgi:hypothetical protein
LICPPVPIGTIRKAPCLNVKDCDETHAYLAEMTRS